MEMITFCILVVYIVIAFFSYKQYSLFNKDLKTKYRPILIPIHSPGNLKAYPSLSVIDSDINRINPNFDQRENLFQIFLNQPTPNSTYWRKIAMLPIKNIGGGPAINISGYIGNGISSPDESPGNQTRGPFYFTRNNEKIDIGDIFGANMLGANLIQVFQCELAPKAYDQNKTTIRTVGRYREEHQHRVYYLNITYENIFSDERYRLTAFYSPHDTGRWEDINNERL